MPVLPRSQSAPLARHDGEVLFTAVEAILKGLLEAETPASVVTGPRTGAFAALFDLDRDDAAVEVLRGHDLRLRPVPTAARAVTLGLQTTREGRGAVALVPHDHLTPATAAIARASTATLPRGGALLVLVEDDPGGAPAASPRRLLARLGMPTVEPADTSQLRDMLDAALRLSRAANRAVGVVVHASVLRSMATIEARPNRVIESVDALLARRRRGRRPRLAESSDVLRMVRRLELNVAASLPSPGERMPVGFVTVGPTADALAHLLHVLRITGRVPIMRLGAVNPIDDVALMRLLERCEQVVVLEPRPGEVESVILQVAETMRHRGATTGTVWSRVLPPAGDGPALSMADDEALHPSLLARRVVHMLHNIRRSGHGATTVAPDQKHLSVIPPPRNAAVGSAAALAIMTRMAADVDEWLADRPLEEEEDPAVPVALSIDGAPPRTGAGVTVHVETWDSGRFRSEGIAALRQAAREDGPWVFLVSGVDDEDGVDLERLARGVIPAERADRVRIETTSLSDSAQLTEVMRAAVLASGLTVVIVTDETPALCDVGSIERSLAEVDRLGFEPRVRTIWPVARACEIRRSGDERVEPRSEPDQLVMRTRMRVDRVSDRGELRGKVRPLFEQVELVRSRPPVRRWRQESSARLPLPEIVHRSASVWRVHLAGFTRQPPGLAARVLAEAGRRMGYHVRCDCDPQPIGAGRRAWAQVLFTRPRSGETALPLSPRIPFGEADLLLGLDAAETLRAIASDPALVVASSAQTWAVVNTGRFTDEPDTEAARAIRSQLVSVLRETVRGQGSTVEDFAQACRTWFHTDRVVGLVLTGAAFQMGVVPVTVEAIEAALAEVEAAGCGRALDAFQFGRSLALEDRLFSRPRENRGESRGESGGDERGEDVGRLIRRMVHVAGWSRWRGAARAEQFGGLLDESLARMPGLAETDPGRQSIRDFVAAVYRCEHWGGAQYSGRYAQLITSLYAVDRGDTGRALTRAAVLPLASAMLIRDPFFVASMATSGEQRRRTRRALNVKRARGDELKRRYLTRVELIAFGKRYRADVRTSDWPARVVAGARRLVPQAWRGTRRDRALRAYMIKLTERAIAGSADDYDRYLGAFGRLEAPVLSDRLRGRSLAQIKLLAEGPIAPLEGGAASSGRAS